MATHEENYRQAIESDKESARIENRLALPDLVDKEAYLMAIAAFTFMKFAYEILLKGK